MSKIEYCFVAEMMPMLSPMIIEIVTLRSASLIVVGKRTSNSSSTGLSDV